MNPDYRHLSFWHDSLPAPVQARPGLDKDISADVAIVGAGYTGLWTAYYLKQFDPALDIVMLEAEIAGFGASGRNGGWCSSSVSGFDRWIADPRYRESALRLKRLMFETVAEVGRVAEREAIDCHYERCGALEVAVLPVQVTRLQAQWRYLQDLDLVNEHYTWLEANEVADIFKIDRALAGIHLEDCAAIHPARLARGLAHCVEGLGVRIFEHSAVQNIREQILTTAGGKVRADTVLLCTEGYTAALAGQGPPLIPVHSMMVATEPLSQQQLKAIGFQQRCTFGNSDRVVTYGQVTADRRIAFGCRGTYLFGSGIRRSFDSADAEFDLVRTTLLRFFPALKGIPFTHAWGGAMGVSRALWPSINFDVERHFGWAGAYFGSGVAAAHLAGQTLADLVVGRDTERLQTPWVNPPYANRQWEPEPLRWLGVRTARSLMGVADRFEYRGGKLATVLARTLDRMLPDL